MKCDDFFANLETGSPVARLRARLHAWRCPRCAAARERLIQLQTALDEPATLSAFHRRVWEQAASQPRPEPNRRTVAWPQLAVAGGLALAATVVMCVTLPSLLRNELPQGRPVATNGAKQPSKNIQTIALAMAPGELADLEHGLRKASADLDRLAEQAALIEVRNVIGELTAAYRPLGPRDSG